MKELMLPGCKSYVKISHIDHGGSFIVVIDEPLGRVVTGRGQTLKTALYRAVDNYYSVMRSAPPVDKGAVLLAYNVASEVPV